MTTNLYPIGNGVSILLMQNVALTDLDEVDAWLYAIDMMPKERHKVCQQILTDGTFSVCNIEHRVEVCCRIRV